MWRHHRLLFIALVVLTVARWVLAGCLELSPDEAYYKLWSQHLDWSYYSKGPGVASAIWLGTHLFGDTAFGVRFFAPLLGLGTSLLIYRLGRSLFDGHTGAWSVVLLNCTPIFNAGSIVMTIDPPSVFFWTASLYALWTALHRASPGTPYWWLAGALAGAGFLFKYTDAFLLAGLLLLPLASRWRGLWRSPGPWMYLAAFGVCTIPVVVWNQQNGWITLTHLLERGKIGEATGYHAGTFLETLALHAGVYSPLIFVGLLWAGWQAAVRARHEAPVLFVAVFSLPIVVFYFALSFKETGEPNWTAPGFVGLGWWLVAAFRRIRWSATAKGALRGTALGLGILLCAAGLNCDLLRKAGAAIPYDRDPLVRLKGWKETALATDRYVREAAGRSGRPVFVVADRYQLAAALAHALPADSPLLCPPGGYPRVHVLESPNIRNQFSFWPRYDGLDPGRTSASPFLGQDALFVTNDADDQSPPLEVVHAFAKVEPSALVEIRRLGLPVRQVKIFACSGYRGLDW